MPGHVDVETLGSTHMVNYHLSVEIRIGLGQLRGYHEHRVAIKSR